MFVEVKRNGKWESVDTWEKDDSGKDFVKFDEQMFIGRNYNLFGILANVRNENHLTPISLPKGLPCNLSARVKKMAHDDLEYTHDHSYLTLQELLKYDWNRKATDYGYLSKDEYKKWDGKTEPEGYCKGVSGPNIRIVNTEKIKNTSDNDGKSYYTIAAWEQTYGDFAENFYHEIIPKLKKLGKPKDVRIVFYFG